MRTAYTQLSLNCLIILDIFSKRWMSCCSRAVACEITRNVAAKNHLHARKEQQFGVSTDFENNHFICANNFTKAGQVLLQLLHVGHERIHDL